MFPRSHSRALRAALLCILLASAAPPAPAQHLSGIDRERGQVMLKQIKGKIKDNYYDPTFHGVDLEATFKAADERLKQATSLGQMFGIIAQAVMSLNDSHTIFIPPQQTVRSEYGWEMLAVGDRCYVSTVKPGEVLARVVQLEKRGTVVGDRTSGKVMRSRYYGEQMGIDTAIFWGVSVTDADLVMSDGKSLENTGVTPDVLKLPEGADMAAKRDPVLAHAASLLGHNLDPEKAGSFFPREWRK